MAWIRWTAVVSLALALLAGSGAAVYARRSLAVLDGTLQVTGLRAAVRVLRDAADVTHIRAQTPQ
ncbi:hypothetical protein, partial [Verminephrobacter aporrectodeae]